LTEIPRHSDTPLAQRIFVPAGTNIAKIQVFCGFRQKCASLLLNNLVAGVNNVTAIYSGDNEYEPATQFSSLTVQNSDGGSGSQGNSTTTISSAAATPARGDPVTLSASVAPVSPATGTPTGSVTFFDGDEPIETKELDENGNVSITTDDLAVGVQPRADLLRTFGAPLVKLLHARKI
jgi:hypothetical protein